MNPNYFKDLDGNVYLRRPVLSIYLWAKGRLFPDYGVRVDWTDGTFEEWPTADLYSAEALRDALIKTLIL